MEKRNALNSDYITRAYLDHLLCEVRHIDGVLADTTFEMFGKKFETPIMTTALSHQNNTHENGMVCMAQGAKDAGAACMTGMGPVQEIYDMAATGADLIKIIKPYKNRDWIYERIDAAKKAGALAIGMDIDHAFNVKGYDVVFGDEMRPITSAELREIIEYGGLPFVIKGVLSKYDAQKAVEVGASAVLVSHHNGRLDSSLPPLMVLPEIREVVKKDLMVLVDGQLLSGLDVFKALAVGADGCAVGRVLMPELKADGAKGVENKIRQMTAELRYAMEMCGAKDLKHIDPTVVRLAGFTW